MRSLPFTPNVIKATERVLDAVYNAAHAGLKGDRLAVVAGMTIGQYQQLCEFDPQVREHEIRGRADSELEHATMLAQASRAGDAKASLAILQHVHGWTAKQQVEVQGNVSMVLDQVLEGAAKQLLDKMRIVENDVEGECITQQ